MQTVNPIANITTYPFSEDFISSLADDINREYCQKNRDLGSLAIVFGGKRPALFLKRELARRLGRGFVSPLFFTIDEWMRWIVEANEPFRPQHDLDQCYFLYNLARRLTPQILEKRPTFARFLPWSREILNFIDQLDLELVDDDKLTRVQENARIGYPVPNDINLLLENIVVLRGGCHEHMFKTKIYSRGFQYRRAAYLVQATSFESFDRILFCNFFYLNRCEQAVAKHLHQTGKAAFFFQGDERRWPVFKRTASFLGTPIREGEEVSRPRFDLKLYQGFDVQSQAGIVKEILKTVPRDEKTVIVLPDADHMIPLLSEIAGLIGDFNISMGYPLKRSSVYALLGFLFEAQLSRQEEQYYARDYLKVLRHPLVKNLKIGGHAAATRVLVHKIEEVLTGKIMTPLSGRLFLSLDDLLECRDIYALAASVLKGMQLEMSREELKTVLAEIHRLVFVDWQTIRDFAGLAVRMQAFLQTFLKESSLRLYPLNLKIAERILILCEELENAEFSRETFPPEDLFRIFTSRIDREMVSFKGSPLKGLQVLGLFETRSLHFDNVIVMDVNEGVLPRLNIYEPLIPREVMIGLNLDRLEQEEEIQRYQFMRLISSAKNVHLVYQQSRDKERSRFVEELVWDAEREKGRLGTVRPATAGFKVEIFPVRRQARKTPAMMAFLKQHRFSASSIDTYLRNPWEFYMNYVLGLRDSEDLLNEPEGRQVGAFVHELLEETFKRFTNKQPRLDAAFRRYFRKTLDEKFERVFGRGMRSESFLFKAVIDERMNRFLAYEAEDPERRVQEILFLEQAFEDIIPLSCGKIKFIYKVDRVDRMSDGTVLLLDYKTGSSDPMPKGLERIENLELTRENILEDVRSFQIPLYFYYLDKFFPHDEVDAAFYNLREITLKRFLSRKMGADRPRINRAFLRALDFVVSEILDAEVPFVNVD